MRVEFYGLVFETPMVTCYLWSPWRASALEHRLFNEVRQVSGITSEQDVDEMRLQISDAKAWKATLNVIARVMKGWQEEAAGAGRERRAWRWMFEGDTDDHGYEYTGETTSIWVYLRLALDRGSVDEGEKGEEIDLNGFGVRIWPESKP